MGKGKLEKFADMRDYPHVFEYPYSVVDNVPFEMKGNWNRDFFKNDNPIVLELGCGRGEYTVGLERLTSTYFMNRYRKFLKPDGLIHLKTDSNFMFTYTRYMVEENRLPVEFLTEDLYHSGLVDDILGIRTYYEQQWLDRGLNIKYMKFRLPQEGELREPDVEIELDEYRSYNRSKRSGLQTSK